MSVQRVQRRDVPALDDAFAKSLGDAGVETVDALRERVRSDLTARRERAAREELRRSVMDQLIARSEFDVPPGMVQRRLSQRIETAHEQLAQFMSHDELHERLHQWEEDWRKDAEREVRESLLLDAIATQEQIAVGDEEVSARIAQLAREQGMAAERLRKSFEERGGLVGLAARLRSEKALDRLLAEAKVAEASST